MSWAICEYCKGYFGKEGFRHEDGCIQAKVEDLEAENARLRAALEEIENHKIHFQYSKYGEPSEDYEYTIECMKDIAREALGGEA